MVTKNKGLVGTTYHTNYGEVVILEYINNYKVKIKFLGTGTICYKSLSSIRKGSVRDTYKPTIFGVGYFGDGFYKSRVKGVKGKTKPYACWENMLARCYYPKTSRYEAYGGKGVTVCDEWHNLQIFGKWFDENYRGGQALEKDILVPNSKVYSPETCCFVPQAINGVLVNSSINCKYSKLPVGVRSSGACNYQAYTSIRGVVTLLGNYPTPEIAYAVYIIAKQRYVDDLVKEYYDKGELDVRIKDRLNSWFDLTEHLKLLKENNIEY